MYVILTRTGKRIAIIGMHVIAVEADTLDTSTVVMVDGTRYETSMQAELIIRAVMDLRQNEVRG